MSGFALRVFRDELAPLQTRDLQPDAIRVLYVERGRLTVRCARQVSTLGVNSTWHGSAGCRLQAGAEGVVFLRWEVVTPALTEIVLSTTGQGEPPRAALEREIAIDEASSYLIRCDRVDFPLGGIAYTHTHRGPGIRCLLTGAITVAVNGAEHRITPGQAWFEAGPDPVLATASDREPTAFVRVMILPAALRGKSSIEYVLPEDRDKPKRQTYQLFIDDPIVVA